MTDGTNLVSEEQTQAGNKEASVPEHKGEEKAPDFVSVTDPPELVLLYNEMVRTAIDPELGLKASVVESFASNDEGHKALQTLYDRIQKKRAEVLNKAKGKGASTKKKGKTVKSATPAKKVAAKGKASTKKAAAAANAAPAKKTNGAAGARSKVPDTSIINWKGGKDGENPCRKESGRYERVERVRKFNGKTVAAFVKAGGKIATLLTCMNEMKIISLKTA